MLVEGAMMKYGLLKITGFLLLCYLLTFQVLALTEFGTFTKVVISGILEISTLCFLYGFLFPTMEMRRLNKTTPTFVEKDLSDIKGKYMIPGSHFWVATIKDGENTSSGGEKVVGCVLAEPYDTKKDKTKIITESNFDGKVAQLRRLSVDVSIRRQGIGGKLVDEVKRFCLKNGYQMLILTTYTSNQAAINMYKKAGFEYRKKYLNNHFTFPVSMAALVMKL